MTQPADPRLRVWDRPADKLRAAAETTYDTLRSDPGITQPVRNALIAERYLRLQADMAALQQRTTQTAAVDTDALEQILFRPSGLDADPASVALAMRDAQDRVQQVQNDPAPGGLTLLQLLRQAELSGDETLAQAAFNATATAGFWADADVLNEFLAKRPAKRDAFERLQAAQQPLDFAAIAEFAVPVPGELDGLSESAILNVAAKAGDARQTASNIAGLQG